MNVREINSRHLVAGQARPRRRRLPAFLVVLALAGMLSWLFLGTSHASSPSSPVKSGWSGYCLDDYLSKDIPGNKVDLWSCNNSSAQDWRLNLTQIIHDSDFCLTADSSSNIDLQNCSQAANQVWLRDNDGFLNPNSGLCLTADQPTDGQQLMLSSCNNLTSQSQKWTPNLNYSTYSCSGNQGQMVACYAIKEWINWTSQPNNHLALLNEYTAGASYEEWCADFVSYVYKEAGYPFSNGNYNNWDENIAGDVVNQGFNVQQSSAYVPEPGDIAYFDYPGGHVEIVISGGKTPTFIYGNSAKIDPTTGNGDMAANTLTSEPNLGSLQYYMSPNPST